ncbi:ATP-dependent nuclease [Aliarcobacter lanthieri]|uniref:ATP-dependent nuclease n=1 Tax=Aliarcobacter lanthieri TaxID=1355374 RepID=UPI003AABA2D9
MNISRVYIKNFRNFEDFGINFTNGFQTIIGENNIGKSNFYYAIRLILDQYMTYRDRSLGIKDFYNFEELTINSHIIISLDLFGNDLASFPNLHALNTSQNTARITYLLAHKSKFIDDGTIFNEIKIEDFKWKLYGAGNSYNIDDILTFGEIHFNDIEGINLFHISAFRNIYNDIQGKSKSLLSQYCLSRENSDTELNSLKGILDTASTQLNALNFIPNIKEKVEETQEDVVGKNFSYPLSLEFKSEFDEDIWNQLNLYYEHNGQNIPIELLGLGQKNIIYLSLFISRLRNEYNPHELNILLIEEPESHLHPQLQKILFSNLQGLNNIQTFMTSHSTHIASDCEYKNLNVIYKNIDNKVQSFSPFTSNVLTGRDPEFLKRYLDATRSELFFASGIIFVEGIAEQFLIPVIAKKVLGVDLLEHNISVVSIHCRYFEPFMKLLQVNGFEIPASIIIDGDSAEIAEGENETTAVQNARVLEIENRVNVYSGTHTLEIDLFPDVNTNGTYLQNCFVNLGHERSYNSLIQANNNGESWGDGLIRRIDNTVSKGRFSQELSLNIDENFNIPVYLENAIKFVCESRGIQF